MRKVGDKIVVFSDLSGDLAHDYEGVISKITPKFIAVEHYCEHQRFHRGTGRMVGYSWPHLTSTLQKE